MRWAAAFPVLVGSRLDGRQYPHYPGRHVLTLAGRHVAALVHFEGWIPDTRACQRLMCNSGPWDFAFLGDVPFASAAWVREEDLQRQVWVPDPFNARPVASELLLHGSSRGPPLPEGVALPFASVPGVYHEAMCSML